MQHIAPALATGVSSTYVAGQERRKDPSEQYILAATAARTALWVDELINGWEYESHG